MTQRDALDLLKLGYNIYLGGSAGSGKTYLLKKYIQYLKHNKVGIGITASTGIAATHLNGRTIHSWCGMGIKNTLTQADIRALLDKPYLKSNFLKTKVLIIDEISMLHVYQLEMVDMICKAFKQNDLPFGGLQVVLCGDFFQLPPVSKNGEDNKFVYESQIWKDMDIRICYLHEQHRQEDKIFLKVLSDIRTNSVTEETKQILLRRYNQQVDGKIIPTKLYTHNVDADSINNTELGKIEEKPQIYKTESKGIEIMVEVLKKNCLAPEILILKKGAAVMFVKNNFDKGYVNGTLGKVIGFDKNDYPVVETYDKRRIIASPEKWTIEENNEQLAEIIQIPLRLAWAITVHKSQGMSLDSAQIDLSKTFEYGMGYVALSRVRRLNGIKLMGINDRAFQINSEIVELDKKLIDLSKQEEVKLSKLRWWTKWVRQKYFLKKIKS